MWQGWVLCKSLSFRSSMHLFLKGCCTVNYVFYSTEKTTEAKMMKAGGTEIGKTLAEKSRGLFSANDWQCKTYVNYKWEGSWGALLRFVTDLTHRRLSSLCNADVVMWIGRGDQSATCVTLRSMPSWKRERVRIFCIWDERAALEFFFFFSSECWFCDFCCCPCFLGYGGGFNERENVEYIEREESDGEYDEVRHRLKPVMWSHVCNLMSDSYFWGIDLFVLKLSQNFHCESSSLKFWMSQFGRKKKKYRGKTNSTSSSKESEKKEAAKEEDEEDEDEEDEDGDLSKYKLDVRLVAVAGKWI